VSLLNFFSCTALEQFGETTSSLSEDKSIYCIPLSFLKHDTLAFLSLSGGSGTLESSAKGKKKRHSEQLKDTFVFDNYNHELKIPNPAPCFHYKPKMVPTLFSSSHFLKKK
jgi:hypothetical protein